MIVAARLLRDRRTATLWWAAGFIALTLFTVAFYPSIKDQRSIEDLLADMPETFRTMVGYQPDVPLSSPAGYLHARLFSTIAPVLAIVYGIGGGARAIAGSEEAGTLEPLLANPVTRGRVLAERYLATFALLLALTAVFTLALLVLARPFDALDGISLADLLGACGAVFTLGLLHGTLAFTIGAATGRRGPARRGGHLRRRGRLPHPEPAQPRRQPPALAGPQPLALVPRPEHARRRPDTGRDRPPRDRLRRAPDLWVDPVPPPRPTVNVASRGPAPKER